MAEENKSFIAKEIEVDLIPMKKQTDVEIQRD